MLRKSLFIFLLSAILLSCTTVGIAQEQKGLDFAKQLAKDIIAGDCKNVAILAVKETLGEGAILELEKELGYAGIPFTFQEIELSTAPELRSAISSILKPEIKGLIPLGDASALQSIIAQMRNLGVEQPVYMYTTTEEGRKILKEKDIMPTYAKVMELERPTKEDILFLKNKDKLIGTVLNPSIDIRTSYADISFDIHLIAGITLEGEAHMERIYTVNQNSFSGFIDDPAIKFRLSGGSEITIRKEKIAKIVFHVREKELQGIPRNDVMYLTNGDIITGRVTDDTLHVKTTYADIPIKVGDIRQIAFIAGENVLTKITLSDTTQVQGILQNDDIHIDLDAGPPITIYQDRITEARMRVGYEEPIELLGMGGLIEEVEGMVLIPAGKFFLMGSNNGEDNEKPVHPVYLDAYYIDKYEVTNKQYREFVEAMDYVTEAEKRGWSWGWTRSKWEKKSGANWKHPEGTGSSIAQRMNHPVVHVSWNDAQAYVAWCGKRLPTEAEWEKAARGGLAGEKYPWGDGIDSGKANYGNNVGKITPVGNYPPNSYGLYDMAGNVWEWCSDWYDENYYARSPLENPRGPNNASCRVGRGGGWDSDATYLRCAGRSCSDPGNASDRLGFRCAESP